MARPKKLIERNQILRSELIRKGLLTPYWAVKAKKIQTLREKGFYIAADAVQFGVGR